MELWWLGEEALGEEISFTYRTTESERTYIFFGLCLAEL